MKGKITALALTAAAVIGGAACILQDAKPPVSEDGTITLRMAQTSSENGAIGQAMNAFADEINRRTDAATK